MAGPKTKPMVCEKKFFLRESVEICKWDSLVTIWTMTRTPGTMRAQTAERSSLLQMLLRQHKLGSVPAMLQTIQFACHMKICRYENITIFIRVKKNIYLLCCCLSPGSPRRSQPEVFLQASRSTWKDLFVSDRFQGFISLKMSTHLGLPLSVAGSRDRQEQVRLPAM